MKRIALGILLGLCATAIVAVTSVDNRHLDMRYPIAKYSTTQLSFAVGDANAASTTLYNLNGVIERIDIINSDANTTGEHCDVSIADEDGTVLGTFSTISMDSAARTMKLATSDSTDFNAIPVNGDLVINVDPNGGSSGVVFTVDFNVYLE